MKKTKFQDHPEWWPIYDLRYYRCRCGGSFFGLVLVCDRCFREFTQQQIVDYEKSQIKAII